MAVGFPTDLPDFSFFELGEELPGVGQVGRHSFVSGLVISAQLARHQLGVAEDYQPMCPSILALPRPAISASYSASLFDALKSRVSACSITSPSGD